MGREPRKNPEPHDRIDTVRLARARTFLEQKLRELLLESGLPALAAVLVRESGEQIIHAQQGVRRAGHHEPIQPGDQFIIGSCTKVVTGTLVGRLLELRLLGSAVDGTRYKTRMDAVFQGIWGNGTWSQYKAVTIEQLIDHTSGMPYQPSQDDDNDWPSYDPADMIKAKLRARRVSYVKAAVRDQPQDSPGAKFIYGGGPIIVASMAEQLTGQTYEDLMKEHVFKPLGMTNSRFGVPAGAWMHDWDEDSRTLKPSTLYRKAGFNWHCRAPVGNMCCNAHDLGAFLAEQLTDEPKITSSTTRTDLQSTSASSATNIVHGSWGSSNPGTVGAQIGFEGDLRGVSRAIIQVNPSDGMGMGAMTTTGENLGRSAVMKLMLTMRAMHDNWNDAFDNLDPPIQAVYAAPAVAWTAAGTYTFGRTHDGRIIRHKGTTEEANWHLDGDFGGSRIDSGIAACVLPNLLTTIVCARGLDTRFWSARSGDGGLTWSTMTEMGVGTFMSGPGTCVAEATGEIFLMGIGEDRKMWRFRSQNGGNNWDGRGAIGNGVFTSAPAVAASSDGSRVHAVGRGDDLRFWYNRSFNRGETYQDHWTPIGEGLFASGPAAICSFDGATVYVAGRGLDNVLWCNVSTDGGATWLNHWRRIGDLEIWSTPVLRQRSNGAEIMVYALGNNLRIHGARSTNGMKSFASWQPKGSGVFL